MLAISGCISSKAPEDRTGPSDPRWGELAESAEDADWFLLEGSQSPSGGYAVFEIPLRSDQVYREGSRQAIILEVGIADCGAEPEAFAVVTAVDEPGPWQMTTRAKASTTYTNETLGPVTTTPAVLSLEPFYINILDPPQVERLRIAVGAIGPEGRWCAILSPVAFNPQESVPANTSAELLALVKGRGAGHRLAPAAVGNGLQIMAFRKWTYSGAFGKEQGLQSYGELQYSQPVNDSVNTGIPAGPFSLAVEPTRASGAFRFGYAVQPAIGIYNEQGTLLGAPTTGTGTISPAASGLGNEAYTSGLQELTWSLSVTRLGAPDLEELFVQAALFQGPLA